VNEGMGWAKASRLSVDFIGVKSGIDFLSYIHVKGRWCCFLSCT
jgi:hypothetical protein